MRAAHVGARPPTRTPRTPAPARAARRTPPRPSPRSPARARRAARSCPERAGIDDPRPASIGRARARSSKRSETPGSVRGSARGLPRPGRVLELADGRVVRLFAIQGGRWGRGLATVERLIAKLDDELRRRRDSSLPSTSLSLVYDGASPSPGALMGTKANNVRVRLRLLAAEEGGRSAEIASGYRMGCVRGCGGGGSARLPPRLQRLAPLCGPRWDSVASAWNRGRGAHASARARGDPRGASDGRRISRSRSRQDHARGEVVRSAWEDDAAP